MKSKVFAATAFAALLAPSLRFMHTRKTSSRTSNPVDQHGTALSIDEIVPGTAHIAVVHIGPHKTGTTAIQSSSRKFSHALGKDNYHVSSRQAASAIGTCCRRAAASGEQSFQRRMGVNCTDPAGPYQRVRSDARRNPTSNLLVSHEDLDKKDVAPERVKGALARGWHVRVVAAYRRFFVWAPSMYAQVRKKKRKRNGFGHWRGPTTKERHAINKTGRASREGSGQRFENRFESFVDWWDMARMESYYQGSYTAGLVVRYQEAFGPPIKFLGSAAPTARDRNHTLSVLNMHKEDVGLLENFYCRHLPKAEHACAEICHDAVRNATSSPKMNHRKSTYYEEIAQEAHFHGLLDAMDGPVQAEIQHFHETVLNRTLDDLPKRCLPRHILDRMLELSIEAERTIVPEFFASDLGEQALREQFWVDAASSKLCSVDTDALLEDRDWLEFFGDRSSM